MPGVAAAAAADFAELSALGLQLYLERGTPPVRWLRTLHDCAAGAGQGSRGLRRPQGGTPGCSSHPHGGRGRLPARPGVRCPPVASTLPATLTAVLRPGGALPAYSTGLLPEGHQLGALDRAVKTSLDDEPSLLLAVGTETIGHVQDSQCRHDQRPGGPRRPKLPPQARPAGVSRLVENEAASLCACARSDAASWPASAASVSEG